MERRWGHTAFDCNSIIHIALSFSPSPQVDRQHGGNQDALDEGTALWAGQEGGHLLLSGKERRERDGPAKGWLALLPGRGRGGPKEGSVYSQVEK